MNIYLDMDGVLADFLGGVARLLDRPLDPKLESWGLGAAFGISNNEAWKRIEAAGSAFWSGLEPLPWCDAVVTLAASFGDVAFLSSSGGYPDADAGKRQWLRARFGSDVADQLILVGTKRNKHRLAKPGAVLVDDHEDTVGQWRASGGHGVLFPAAWNYKRGEEPIAEVRSALVLATAIGRAS